MSSPYTPATPTNSHGPLGMVGFWAVVLGVTLATLGAVLLANPFLAIAPVAAVGLLMAVARLPLRTTTSFLIVLALGIDDHQDAAFNGAWRSPLAIVGDLVKDRFDKALGIPGLAITGLEIALVVLLAVYVWRRISGSRIDTEGQVPFPPAIRDLMVIYVAAVLLSQVVALSHGLPVAPWKLRNLLHPIALTILFLAAFRPMDFPLVGRVLTLCACMRGIEVVIVQRIAIAETGGHFESGTSHGDSILFAVVAVIILVGVLEHPSVRTLRRAALVMPIMIAAAVENERRLVWVMIAITMIILFLLVPMKGWKLRATKILLTALPILAGYVGAGWNSPSKFFAPVHTIRSVADTSIDHSAYWREVEDFNIAITMRDHLFLGTGLSGRYSDAMPNDDISDSYPEYREWPHNSILGLLLLMGVIGFTGISLLLPAAIFLAARTYRISRDPETRVAAMGCVGAALACLVQAYGDLGAHFTQYKFLAALAVAMSARLAVQTGAFPIGSRTEVEPS